MNTFTFRHMTTNKILTVKYNKSKNLMKYRNKWINPIEIYNKGYEDGNLKQTCIKCQTKLKDYKFYCSSCKTKINNELTEIVKEIL